MENQTKNQISNSQTQHEQQVVLFKFKRAYRQESFDEIKIHSKKIKANPQSSEKATEEYKKRHFFDREAMLTEMFQKLELQNNSFSQKNEKKENSQQQNKPSYFLKRVDFQDLQSEQSQKKIVSEDVKLEAGRIRNQIRKKGLEKKMNKNRGIFVQPTQNDKKRIKYKIIDIRKENLVELNGEKIEYEDLSKEYSEQEKSRMSTVYDYYVLRKGKLTGSTNGYQPEIVLPEQAQYLLQQQNQEGMNQQTPSESQDDSNREDRSDYDYPEEDYHEGNSDNQSEGIISGGRHRDSDFDESSNNSDDQYNLKNDYRQEQEDEEEYYRQYLKRCRRKQQGDNEITYLYNMKAVKYEDDSDEY